MSGHAIYKGKIIDAPVWQPIETAPDGTRVLLYAKGHLIMLGGWAGHGSYFGPSWYSNCVPIVPRPTHWMPTPELPEAT